MTDSTVLHGIVQGKTIQLEAQTGFPDGQAVVITVQPLATKEQRLPPGEGIQRAAGGWADDPEGLDAYLEWNRRQRKQEQRRIDS
jgi:hypothetical protein